MTRERAKTLASKWSAGCVCSLREGEAEEYHKMFYDILREKQYVKPETNADRIRAMNDEELAIMFAMLKADLTRLDRPVRQFSGRDVNGEANPNLKTLIMLTNALGYEVTVSFAKRKVTPDE